MLSKRTKIILNLFIPQEKKPNSKYAIPESDKILGAKVIVFTGGTDGIGKVAVEMLYNMGAKIILIARNKVKATSIIENLQSNNSNGSIVFQECDLSSMDSVSRCCESIINQNSKIDILVNCAGINSTSKTITDEGFEINWAVNYLAPYLLTTKLLPKIIDSTSSRIINITTDTNFIDELNLEDLRTKPDFNTSEAYTESKLSLNMFTIDLSKELENSKVTVNCLYPGYIKSNLLRDLKGGASVMKYFMNKMASPVEVGADRIVRVAISSEYSGVNGIYVSKDEITPHHKEATQDLKRKQLRDFTELRLNKWLN